MKVDDSNVYMLKRNTPAHTHLGLITSSVVFLCFPPTFSNPPLLLWFPLSTTTGPHSPTSPSPLHSHPLLRRIELFLELGWCFKDVKSILWHGFSGRKQASSFLCPLTSISFPPLYPLFPFQGPFTRAPLHQHTFSFSHTQVSISLTTKLLTQHNCYALNSLLTPTHFLLFFIL